MRTGWWVCANYHVFSYGNEEWHAEVNQYVEDGYPVPYYCQADEANGDPCLDSTHLWGPMATKAKARIEAHVKQAVAEAPPLSAEQRDKLAWLFKDVER